jgi:hypothetical protein
MFETLGHHRRRFVFVDAHFAHRDQDAHARQQAALLILARLPQITANLPLI